MIYTLDEARDILHLDGEDNDEQILALLDAIPPYLTATTGYESVTGDYSPVARAAARFILWQWYPVLIQLIFVASMQSVGSSFFFVF